MDLFDHGIIQPNIAKPQVWGLTAQVGNEGLTYAEQRAHFALWAIMKSPLLLGCDLRSASAEVGYTRSGAMLTA